ncbi:MAG: hypothetical protein JO103_14335, partial [Candidatus Eremiobacteraeota bacterium]|nr:hypothetical protein [Candidatus Eremiobacteraeota bacterium]
MLVRIGAAVLALLVVAGAGSLPTLRQDMYYASPSAEAADRTATFAAADALRATAIDGRTSAAALVADLHRYDDVLRRLHRHEGYLYLRSSENVSDTALSSTVDAVDAAITTLDAAMTRKLGAIDDHRLALLEHGDPALHPYDYAVRRAHAAARHTLPDAQEAVAARLGTSVGTWLGDEYRRRSGAAAYATVTTTSGAVDPRTEAATASADPAVRRAAAESRARGRAGVESALADLLFEVVRVQTDAARLHGFADAPAAAYTRLGLTADGVHAVVAAVRRAAGANQDYQRLLVSAAAKAMPAADVR